MAARGNTLLVQSLYKSELHGIFCKDKRIESVTSDIAQLEAGYRKPTQRHFTRYSYVMGYFSLASDYSPAQVSMSVSLLMFSTCGAVHPSVLMLDTSSI